SRLQGPGAALRRAIGRRRAEPHRDGDAAGALLPGHGAGAPGGEDRAAGGSRAGDFLTLSEDLFAPMRCMTLRLTSALLLAAATLSAQTTSTFESAVAQAEAHAAQEFARDPMGSLVVGIVDGGTL